MVSVVPSVSSSRLSEPSNVVAFFTPRLLRIPQAALYIGGTNWQVEEVLRGGEIPYRVIGKYRVLEIADLDEWIAKQPKHTNRSAS